MHLRIYIEVIMKSVLRTSGDTVATVHSILSYSAGFLCMCASRDAQIRRRSIGPQTLIGVVACGCSLDNAENRPQTLIGVVACGCSLNNAENRPQTLIGVVACGCSLNNAENRPQTLIGVVACGCSLNNAENRPQTLIGVVT